MKEFVLPEKWCVKDCLEVTMYAHKLWGCGKHISDEQYYHSPDTHPHDYEFLDYVKRDYTKITFEQFKQYVLNINEPIETITQDYEYLTELLTKLNIN